MRKGIYWFNLMAKNEQRLWVIRSIPLRGLSKTYDNFEKFIMGTTPIVNGTPSYFWIGIIDKYSGYDILLPTHHIKKHLL